MAQAATASPSGKGGGKSAKAKDASLMTALASFALYKPNSGRIVRQVTAAAVMIVAAIGAIRLFQILDTYNNVSRVAAYAIPSALFVAGVWFAFRLVNWPKFADFLTDVEMEMAKVSWAAWDYLGRATVVVLVVMFLIGALLFAYDFLWQQIFALIGFIDSKALGL